MDKLINQVSLPVLMACDFGKTIGLAFFPTILSPDVHNATVKKNNNSEVRALYDCYLIIL